MTKHDGGFEGTGEVEVLEDGNLPLDGVEPGKYLVFRNAVGSVMLVRDDVYRKEKRLPDW